jgi:hypothetical protein
VTMQVDGDSSRKGSSAARDRDAHGRPTSARHKASFGSTAAGHSHQHDPHHHGTSPSRHASIAETQQHHSSILRHGGVSGSSRKVVPALKASLAPTEGSSHSVMHTARSNVGFREDRDGGSPTLSTRVSIDVPHHVDGEGGTHGRGGTSRRGSTTGSRRPSGTGSSEWGHVGSRKVRRNSSGNWGVLLYAPPRHLLVG